MACYIQLTARKPCGNRDQGNSKVPSMLWFQLQGKCTIFWHGGHRICSFNEIDNINRSRGPRGLYGGVIPAVIGAIPSSALYFGTYECIKRRLKNAAINDEDFARTNLGVCDRHRLQPAIPMISAACGNMVSSLIFVPKEIVKQKRQAAVALGTGKSSTPDIILFTLKSKVCVYFAAGALFYSLSSSCPQSDCQYEIYPK